MPAIRYVSSGEFRKAGTGFAWAAAAVGLPYAAITAYWALGGRWLLSTVGGQFEQLAKSGGAEVELGVWTVAALKVIGSALPVAVGRYWGLGWRARALRVITTVEAAVLVLYGLVLSVVGWAVQAGVVKVGRHPDRRALVWHAFLWDPWFLLWGLLIAAALRCFAYRRPRLCRSSSSGAAR